MPEWSNGVVSKTIVGTAYRGFESLPLRKMSKLLAVALVGFLLMSSSALGQRVFYEPIIRPLGSHYRVHKTKHFEVIFEEGSEIEAWQTALILERTLPQAQALSGAARPMWMPVILNNSSDQSNGYVHTHPFRQEIEVPHIKGSRLGTRFNSWIEAVAMHELVHATQAHADGPWGLGKVIYWFAPDVARTLNLSLPPGLNEGAAVYFESTQTNGAGRLNDARFQMQYQAAAASERPWSLSQLMESSRYGFHAGRHYIGGANFFAWQYSRDQGFFFQKMRTLRYRYSLRSTGWDLRRATGQSLSKLVADFRQKTTPQVHQNSRKSYIIAGRRGILHRWPQWLNDTTLVVYRRGLSETPGLYSLDLESGAVKLIHAVLLPEDAWFHLADSVMLYSRYVPDRFSTLHSSADVFKYEILKNRETRLTRGARAHMPVHTSSGISALQNDGQRNAWIEIDMDGIIQTILERSQADLIQVAPAEKVTALLVRHSGTQGIYLAESGDGLKPWIFLDGGTIRELAWSSNGRYLLFTADRGGVTNVYCYDLDMERTVQLTDVSYGAMDPALADDDQTLIYIDYQHERYNVVSEEFSPEDSPVVSLTPASTIPKIPSKLELPVDFTDEPYKLGHRLRPRMLLPVGFWSNEAPERRLGVRGGLGIYGSDPLRQITYMTEATIQSRKIWGRAEVRSVLGPVLATIEAYNEPGALVARIIGQDKLTQDVTYGDQSLGIGMKFALPLRFEANVRHSYARITAGVRSERTRWFSLNGYPVPYLRETGQSYAEWESSTRVDAGILLAVGLQQNRRDVWPNRGTVLGVYARTDVYRGRGSARTGLYTRFSQYWSLSRRSNTSMVLGASLLTQNSSGVYSNSLVLPRGYEAFLGSGTHVRIDAEILQPLWYIQNGFLTVPTYFKVLYLYGFSQRVLVGNGHRGEWTIGLGMGLQFRLLHYLDLEVRTSFNPFDSKRTYFTLM